MVPERKAVAETPAMGIAENRIFYETDKLEKYINRNITGIDSGIACDRCRNFISTSGQRTAS